jgi:hypothetical protein
MSRPGLACVHNIRLAHEVSVIPEYMTLSIRLQHDATLLG